MADIGDCRSIFIRHRESRTALLGALDEKCNRVELAQGFDRGLILLARKGEGGHTPRGLSRHPERFAARRQDREGWAGSEERVRQFVASRGKVLAVVEKEEQPTLADKVGEHVDERDHRLFPHAQRASDGLGD